TVSSSSSNDGVATVSASTDATPGTYDLTVSHLAQAQKIASAAQADVGSPLGLSGEFFVNGKSVQIASEDTLQNVAAAINEASAGVTASVIDGGEGNAYLTLTSNTTGADSTIRFSDLSGGVLSSLGLSDGVAINANEVDAETLQGWQFSSDTETIQSLTNSAASGSFTVEGRTYNVDFSTDSLQDIAAAINADPHPDVSASVITIEEDGTTRYALQLSGNGATPTLTDPDGLLGGLGVLRQGFSDELRAAQDAEYTIDGFAFTSKSNQVSDVVPGMTFTLKKADAVTPETTTFTLTKDTDSVKSKFKELVSAYNGYFEFVDSQSKFDEETFESGPLFGDSLTAQASSAIESMIFNNLGTGTYKSLLEIGISVEDGKLSLDEAQLDKALVADSEAVRKLMMSSGSSSNPNIRFVTSGDNTVASGAAGYSVEITQVATKAQMQAGTAQTTANVGGEIITFGGSLFQNSDVQFYVDEGSTLDELVGKINGDARLKDLITATNDGGVLQLTADRYGTAGDFTAVSNLEAAADNSGLGTAGGTLTAGLDVAGTIDGKAVTGKGQFLTGDKPGEGEETDVEGLQIQYSGTTTGNIGSILFEKGLSAQMDTILGSYTSVTDGIFKTNEDSLQSQIDDISDNIARTQDSIADKEQSLRRRFAVMESAISEMNAQMAQLSSMMQGATV
ncbi:MAG: flagellar filament capping protein FliD, partial [Fimbriimonadaceae bacterium]